MKRKTIFYLAIIGTIIIMAVSAIAINAIKEYRENPDGTIEVWEKTINIQDEIDKRDERITFLESELVKLATTNEVYNGCIERCTNDCGTVVETETVAFENEIDSLETEKAELEDLIQYQ